jgi:uncharacterized protein (TIGR00369 family)
MAVSFRFHYPKEGDMFGARKGHRLKQIRSAEMLMRKLNPAFLETVAKTINGCPYFTLISMEMKEMAYGQCRIEVDVGEKHLQNFGIVHGGVYSSLADAAAFWAVYSQIDEALGMTTVEIKLNFLAPTSTGRLIAKGRSIKVGKTLCLGEALIEDKGGKLLAHGTSTMMAMRELTMKEGSAFPPKFLE